MTFLLWWNLGLKSVTQREIVVKEHQIFPSFFCVEKLKSMSFPWQSWYYWFFSMPEKKGLWIYIEVLKLFKQEESPKRAPAFPIVFRFLSARKLRRPCHSWLWPIKALSLALQSWHGYLHVILAFRLELGNGLTNWDISDCKYESSIQWRSI